MTQPVLEGTLTSSLERYAMVAEVKYRMGPAVERRPILGMGDGDPPRIAGGDEVIQARQQQRRRLGLTGWVGPSGNVGPGD